MVDRLILFGATSSGCDLAPERARSALVELIRTHWGLGSRAISDLFVPGLRGDDLIWFSAFQQQTASAQNAAQRLEMYYGTDVTIDARQIQAPTLVLHRSGDRAVPLEHGTRLASLVPDAELEVLDGDAHPPYLGDWQSVLDAVLRFLPDPSGGLPSGPYGELTMRELDVATLTVDGLTNALIGEQLDISPRTVEAHMTSVRQKLGVGTRAEIAAWVSRHGYT
jgi:DNA-binding CsgD family transcriptional regulator